MNGIKRQQARRTGKGDTAAISGSGWRLFGAHIGERLRVFYLRAGLALLVLVAAAIFTAAAWFAPELFGGLAGGRRANAILLFCGVPAIVLAGIYLTFLRPRAVLDAYAHAAFLRFGSPRRGCGANEDEERVYARRTGVYGWSALLWLLAGIAFGAAGAALSRWLGARFSPGSWSSSAVWTLCAVLFWQTRMPLALAQVAAARGARSGAEAFRRGWRLYCRARYDAINAGFQTLLAAVLPLMGILAFSVWIAADDALLRYCIAAFLLALCDPPLRLLLAAFDTATYAEAVRRRVTVNRRACRARRLRTQHDGRKGYEA